MKRIQILMSFALMFTDMDSLFLTSRLGNRPSISSWKKYCCTPPEFWSGRQKGFTYRTTLQMSDLDDSDDLKHLAKEFKLLSRGKPFIEFGSFVKWEEIQALLADDLISMDEIKALWLSHVGSLNYSIDRPIFYKINKDLDEFIAENDTEDDSSEDEDSEESQTKFTDVWQLDVDSSKIFPKEFIAYLNMFHSKHANVDGLLSYHSFREWKDINELMAEGSVDVTCLKEIWQEAIVYKNRRFNPDAGIISVGNEFTLKKNQENDAFMIDFDTFIRVNFRLEEVMEDIRKALEDLSSEDVTLYYSKEFVLLTGGEGLLSFQQLLDWSVVQEALESGQLSPQQFELMWLALPKQPMGYFYRKKGPNSKVQQSDGITLDAFISFNDALDDFLATVASK